MIAMRLIPGATVQVHPSPLKPLNVAYNGRQRYIHATSISNVYCAITWRTCGYFKPSTGGSNRCHCRHNEYGKQESKKKKESRNSLACVLFRFLPLLGWLALFFLHILCFSFSSSSSSNRFTLHCMYGTHSEFGYICGTSVRVSKTNSSAGSHIIHIRVLIFVLLL